MTGLEKCNKSARHKSPFEVGRHDVKVRQVSRVACCSPATFSHLSVGGNRLKIEFIQHKYFVRLLGEREARELKVHFQVNLGNCWNEYTRRCLKIEKMMVSGWNMCYQIFGGGAVLGNDVF